MTEAEQIAMWLENLLAGQLKENTAEYKKAVKDAIHGIRGGWYKSSSVETLCTCAEIQTKDKSRHFKGCVLRVE